MLSLTFLLAVQLGTRVFKLDRQISMLIGAGGAICGAAAVIATEPIVGGQAHKVSLAVATVVILGRSACLRTPFSTLTWGGEPSSRRGGRTLNSARSISRAGSGWRW